MLLSAQLYALAMMAIVALGDNLHTIFSPIESVVPHTNVALDLHLFIWTSDIASSWVGYHLPSRKRA
jgi:hypothetical protein